MDNVQIQVNGNKITIEVDAAKDYGRSASGKTITIASTRGNQAVETPSGKVFIGLNVYKK